MININVSNISIGEELLIILTVELRQLSANCLVNCQKITLDYFYSHLITQTQMTLWFQPLGFVLYDCIKLNLFVFRTAWLPLKDQTINEPNKNCNQFNL